MAYLVPLLFFTLFCTLGMSADANKTDTVVIEVTKPYQNLTAIPHAKLHAPYTLKLGMIGMYNGAVGSAVDGVLAVVEYLNNNMSILPDVAIEVYTSPPAATITGDVDNMFSAVYHINKLKVHGLIGGLSSQESKVIQSVARVLMVPQISPNAITSTLSDKTSYPYFLRTISADSSQIAAIITFFNDCGWKRGVVMYSSDEYGSGYSTLVAQAAINNITLTSFRVATKVASYREYLSTTDLIATQADTIGRIMILYITSPTMVQYAIQAMNQSGLVGPEFVTILTASTPDAVKDPAAILYNSTLLDGVFGVGSGIPYGPMYDTISAFWRTRPNLLQDRGIYVSPFYAMDAVLAFAYAFDTLMSEGVPFEAINRTTLLYQLLNQTFIGTTGPVVLDSAGNRLGRFDLYNFRQGHPASHVGTYSVVDQAYTKMGDYVFYGGSLAIPRDLPYTCTECIHGTCVVDVGCVCDSDYSGTACDVKKSDPAEILPWLIPVIAIFIASFIAGYVFYKKKRSALVKEVAEKQRSQIARGDLTLQDRIGRGASGEVCKAQFRGTEVAVKKIITSHVSKSVIEEFELEVAIMCGLRHPNIIMFMGSCFDPSSQEMLLVMEFMSRGSLNDVLNNPKISITYEMKLSLACQAAQGMNFLHQSTPPLVHRDLKSHNILIDDKWNARISDFGITKFKEDTRSARSASSNKEKSIGTIYWTAPEVLEGNLASEKCDCYSFGIVLWEIFHRQNPYTGRDPVSVAVEVIRSSLRPIISDEVPAEIKVLIQSCWAQAPEDRPSFQEITTTLRKLLSTRSFAFPTETGTRVDAPMGHVYLVSTGVENAYTLWAAIPRGMEDAMKTHNQVVRTNLELYNGYEVSCADHSFLCAFHNLEDSVNFACSTQVSLLHAEWPSDLLAHPLGSAVHEGGELQWIGLRVKMAVCSGVPNCEIDNSSGRMKYFGPVVDRVTQFLGLKGYILAGDLVVGEITKKNPRFVHEITTKKIGDVKSLSVRNKMEDVYQISINSLYGRNVGSSTRGNHSQLPHTIVSMIDYENDDTTPFAPPSPGTPTGPLTLGTISDLQSVNWVTSKSEIKVQESIGKGPIGDYFRGHWRGKEVAVKMLVNQKLKEDDLLKLLGDSAYMSKLSHPNILPFYAVCLEPNYITVVSEYVPRGNLKNLLADNSVQFSFPRKIKIALDLAHGLSFLSTLPDPTFQMHDNLKSNNVLIGKDWEVKVADYGHGNIRELARTMTSVGNIAWTAPEILNGEPATPKIALYAFGIILWELYTRQVPYVNEHPIRVVTKIITGYRPIAPPDCPAAYRNIMAECMDGNPDNRPTWSKVISSLASLAN